MSEEAAARGRGRPSKFDAEYHCQLLIDIGRQGKTIHHFCVEADIPTITFYSWRNTKPEFKEAFDRFKSAATVYWVDECHANISNPHYNFPCFRVLSRAANADPDAVRMRGLAKIKDPNKKYELIERTLETEGICARDLNYLATFVKQGVDIYEQTNLARDVEELKRLNEIQ